jgi:hypothetical protein
MTIYKLIGTISQTSPASASTAVSTASVSGLANFDEVLVEADLVGATGGTLDVYIQRKLSNDLWRDWVHFTQLTAAAPAVKYSVRHGLGSGITTVGGGTDASPGVALAAAASVGGHPGETVRLVFVAGVSTSAGAAIAVRFYGLKK